MNKILLGDSQEVLKTIGDEIVHLTCTSPPYYNAKAYSIWPTYEEYLQFLTNVFEQVFRVTKEGRMCCVNLSPVIQARETRSHQSKRLAIPFHFFSLMENNFSCDFGSSAGFLVHGVLGHVDMKW